MTKKERFISGFTLETSGIENNCFVSQFCLAELCFLVAFSFSDSHAEMEGIQASQNDTPEISPTQSITIVNSSDHHGGGDQQTSSQAAFDEPVMEALDLPPIPQSASQSKSNDFDASAQAMFDSLQDYVRGEIESRCYLCSFSLISNFPPSQPLWTIISFSSQ